MRVYHEEFRVRSSKRTQVLDIAEQVERVVERSGLKDGICLIFLPHATAAIILEEAEAGLIADMEAMVMKKFPRGAGYLHDRIDDNADSHLASGFIGQSRVLPIKDGKLVRGTWQRPLLIELDGPRTRRICVTVLGK